MTEPHAEHERFRRIDAAFRAGDLAALRAAVEDVEILLKAGADPRLRTRIDELETPREIAEQAGLREIVELLAAHEV